jgi:hypothetical protein
MSGIGDSRHFGFMLAIQDQLSKLPNAQAEQEMQDKFAIGPVTIVQLVGLNSKPRIASAQVDAAVRAADPQPPASAAAGLGAELLEKVDAVDAISFDIKAPQALSLTAAPMHGSIALEAAVDRAVPSSDSGKASTPDGFQGNIDLASLIASLRGGSTSPSPAPAPSPAPTTPDAVPTVGDNPPTESSPSDGVTTAAPVVGETVAPETPYVEAVSSGLAEPDAVDFVFDGAESFGDDKILDFETYYAETGLSSSHGGAAGSAVESIELLIELPDYAPFDFGGYHILDVAGLLSPEPHLSGQLEIHVPQHQVSVHDALPPI